MSTNGTMPAFNERETAAVLAGLRLLQLGVEARGLDGLSIAIGDIYTNGGEIEGLTPKEIDELCERLNFGG